MSPCFDSGFQCPEVPMSREEKTLRDKQKTIKHQLRLVKKFWLSWLRNQTSSRAGAHCYEGLAGASRGYR